TPGHARRSFIPELRARATIVGVRFLSGAAPSVLGVPAHALLNTDLPLREIWGRAALQLSERVVASGSAERRLAIVAEAIVGRLAVAHAPDPLVDVAVPPVAWPAGGPGCHPSQPLGLGGAPVRRPVL